MRTSPWITRSSRTYSQKSSEALPAQGYGCLCYFYAPDQHQQGLQGCQPAQVDVLLQEQEGRQRNDSEAPRAGRSVSNRRTGPLLFTYPTRGTEVELQTNPQGVSTLGDEPSQKGQETTSSPGKATVIDSRKAA